MASTWAEFVAQAVGDEPDDAFVRLLRERIQAGHRVVRINLVEREAATAGGAGALTADGAGAAEYLVILTYRKQLQEMRVPHGASFTRWSFEVGARLETAAEEARRFALVLREELEPPSAEVGRGYFNAVLLEVLRGLGPPRALAVLADERSAPAGETQSRQRTASAVTGALRALSRALGRSLGYSAPEAADILDGALAEYVDQRFHLTERRLLFPR